MGSHIENLTVSYISKSIKMTEDEESVIRYGIKVVFYSLFKFLIMLSTAWFLGIVSEACTVFILMAVIRSFAFGFHADTSLSCIFLTFINIFGVIYFSLFDLNPFLKITLSLMSFVLFALYAPADTEERPLIDYSKRKKLKIKVILTWVIYFISSYFVEPRLSNIIVLSLFFMAFNTCPILYILFKKEYKNYEKY